MANITFDISPPEAAKAAQISVDGKDIPGASAQLEQGKPIHVIVRSNTFQPFDKKLTFDKDTTVDVPLKKIPKKPPGGTGSKPVEL
jgi:hypothetical protein